MRRLAACLLAAVAVAGCTSDSALISARRLPDLVLQPADLGAGFHRFDVGPQVASDAQSGPRLDAERFGRQGGSKARFRASDVAAERGALVVVSMADVFRTTDGAASDLEAYRRQSGGGSMVPVPDIGDATMAVTRRQPAGARSLRFYSVAWRYANVTASVEVQGFDGLLTLDDAVRLARKQQARIEAAATA